MMTTLAYCVFIFVACILGLGVGLLLHHLAKFLWRKAPPIVEEDLANSVDATETEWEALSNWQGQNNRRFALQIATCAALPLIAGLAGFAERAQVVGTICTNLLQVAGQSPLCT